MQHSSEQPYLSVVATARNDDHGGNMLRRLQTFVNALLGQARRYAVPMELVLVEWNPPAEIPALAHALQWPDDPNPCRVRIITVPPEIHARYKFGKVLPLYQMIGKNVGIRRAEGEYILATNIDILFSDELMQFIAARRLEPDRMYRVDRYDVSAGVPVDAAAGGQLTYCREHLLRVNAREGTFSLTPTGQRIPDTPDIVEANAGVFFGAGWCHPEQYFGQLFRMACAETAVDLQPGGSSRVLRIELEPAHGSTEGGMSLGVVDSAGKELGRVPISARSCIRIRIPARVEGVRLRSDLGGGESAQRAITWRVFRCEWDRASPIDGLAVSAQPASHHPAAHAWQVVKSAGHFIRDIRTGKGTGRIGLPIDFRIPGRFRSDGSGASVVVRSSASAPNPPELPPDRLHTNACGDFTLVHRRHWMDLRGYPEFDMYSMNLDSVFCYMAHHGGAPEHVLTDPIRIYHIEHSAGSGWTPAGEDLLYRRLTDKGIPFLPYEQVVRWASQMKSLGTTMIFNREDWGIGDAVLSETAAPAKKA